jgi:shikimate kinase
LRRAAFGTHDRIRGEPVEIVAVEHDEEYENGRAKSSQGSNVILIGAMGSGKTTVGWLLARLIGFGFIDVDQRIEARVGKPVERIFAEDGEAEFRRLEREMLEELSTIRSHVISCGGGAVVDDENWAIVEAMGTTVWINTPADEIARRLAAQGEALRQRPLLAELADEADQSLKHRLLTERMSALIGQRQQRYREARLQISDCFSTPESSARQLKDLLVKEGVLTLPEDHRPYDRWHIL